MSSKLQIAIIFAATAATAAIASYIYNNKESKGTIQSTTNSSTEGFTNEAVSDLNAEEEYHAEKPLVVNEEPFAAEHETEEKTISEQPITVEHETEAKTISEEQADIKTQEVAGEITPETDLDLIAQVEQWITYDPNHVTREQVSTLYEAKKFDILRSMFIPRIAFGTAGLRAAMAPGYHNINELVILQASQGLSKWVEENVVDALNRGIVIGYDGRHNSRSYAEITASVFLSRGFKVYSFSDMVCTPLVPYGVLQYKAAVGVMVTASHNPKDDNGYKVYWENGAQIIPPNDAGIADRIDENLVPWELYMYDETNPNIINCDALIEKYVTESTEKLCYHKEENADGNINVTYTAMHGVGAKFVEKTFKSFNLNPYIPTPEQVIPDPDFSTVKFPNPEEGKGALALAIKAANENNSNLILANDPDADRLAVACKNENQEWVMLTGNEIAAVLAEWSWLKWRSAHPDEDPSQCVMIASTVSSKHLKAMADQEGFEFRDTLTGFKWIGNEAINAVNQGKTVLFAYEVEIGFLIGDVSFDKDGVRTAAVFAELANYWSKHGYSILDRVRLFYEKYGHFKMTNSYFFCDSSDKLNGVFSQLRHGNNDSYPLTCGEYQIKSIRDVTTGFDSAQPDGKLLLPTVSDSHMITFTFTNGATVTLRNSGTEPKLKYYVEVSSKESSQAAEQLLESMTAAVVEHFIQPEVFGLVAKSG